MDKKRKKIVPITIILIVLVVIAIVVISRIYESRKIEKLKQEYTALLDERMSKIYEDDDCIEYQLSDISYTVVDLKKKGFNSRYYTVSVVVDCTSNDPKLWSATESLLAYAVEKYVPGGFNDTVETSTGDKITLTNYNLNDVYNGQEMLTVNVNGKHVHGPEIRDYSKSTDNYTKTYDYSNSNDGDAINSDLNSNKTICSRCDGTGRVTKHYGNSWNKEEGYGYGDVCGACNGTGYINE